MNKLMSRSFGVKAWGFVRLGFSGLMGMSAFVVAHGCVPAVRYEEAQSTAEVEAEGRRRTSEALEHARAEIARLTEELRARDTKLEQRDENLERMKLDEARIAKQRDDNASLIDQLRSDLARAGGDLVAATAERNRLEKELERAESALDKSCPGEEKAEARPAESKARR